MATGTIQRKPIYGNLNSSGEVACKTTLTYTGKYITVPAGSYCCIEALAYYNAAAPSSVSINSSSTNANATYAAGAYVTPMAGTSYSTYVSTDTTFYLWAKYATASNNTVAIRAWYVIP